MFEEAHLSYEKTLRVKVIPCSQETVILGYMQDGTLKVRVKSRPEGGKANTELLDLLKTSTGKSWKIVTGGGSTKKLLTLTKNEKKMKHTQE